MLLDKVSISNKFVQIGLRENDIAQNLNDDDDDKLWFDDLCSKRINGAKRWNVGEHYIKKFFHKLEEKEKRETVLNSSVYEEFLCSSLKTSRYKFKHIFPR